MNERFQLSVDQCRMARALLHLSMRDLAKRAKVGTDTLFRFEAGQAVRPTTVQAIRTALEEAGAQFHEAAWVARQGVDE